MTAFAINFQRDRIMVASDTLGYLPDRTDAKPLGFVSKVTALSHIRAVLFGRGMFTLQVRAAAELLLASHLTTIEAVAGVLPELLDTLSKVYAAEHGIQDHSAVGMLEVVLAGWSAAEQRMRAWSFDNYGGYEVHSDSGDAYGLITFPKIHADYMPVVSDPPSRADYIAMLEAARRMFADEPVMAGAKIGGEVVLTEVTPSSIGQEVVHRFADYEQTRHAAEAIVARIVRGDLKPDLASALVPVGEMVDMAAPAAATAVPKPNRQQRRAAERRAA